MLIVFLTVLVAIGTPVPNSANSAYYGMKSQDEVSPLQTGNVTIHDTQLGLTRAAKLIGKLPADKRIGINVILQFRSGTDPESYVASIYDLSSANYQHFLTPESFADAFGPSIQDYQSVIDWLTSQGITVAKSYPDRMVIEASANAKTMEMAFGVTFSVFRYGNVTFFSNNAEAQVPPKVGSLIRTVAGFHNYTSMKPGLIGTELDPTYNPTNIRTAYDETYLVGNLAYTGAGQTIDILDAYDYPNLFTDLASFDSAFSLPAPPTITKVTINSPSTCPSGQNYCWETALDTQWAHVMAPGANLHVVLVPNLSDSSLITGISYVVNTDLTSGGVFSNSWGGPEMCSFLGIKYQCDSSFVNSVHPLLLQAASQGVSTFFSSGDHGAYESGVLTANYPASDPWVTAVGGTSLNSVTGPAETAWSGSGGGISAVFPEPTYQSADFSLSGRGVPDVSMDADPATGVYVYCNQGSACSGWGSWGGTSLSAPLWAGSVSVLNQATGTNLGFLNPLIYAIYGTTEYSMDFHDITSGNNGYYSTSTGWDAVTGLGSPDLFKTAQNRGMTKVSASPSTVSQGQSVSYSGSGFTPSRQVQVVIWTDGTGYTVGTPTATNSGTISGSFVVGTYIPLGQRKVTFLDVSSGFVATTYVMVTYTVTFQESGIPSGVTWGVTVGGTRYTSAGSSVTLSGLTQPVSYSYDSTVPGMSGVQYVCTLGCSGSLSGPVTVTANYATVVTMTVSYSVAGGGAAHSDPVFNYIHGGQSNTYTLTATSTDISVDSGSVWSVTPNPLAGSTPSERWYSSQTLGGTASTTAIVFTFYHQYLQTLSYSVNGGGSGYSAPTFTANRYGASASEALTSTATGYWYDAGSSWSMPNPLSGSGTSERWITTQTTSGTISSTQTIAFTYQNQYYLTTQVSPSIGGTVTVSSGWQNSGTTVPVSETPSTGYSFYYWSLDGTNVGTGSSYSLSMNSAHILVGFFRGSSSMSLGLSSGTVDLGGLVTLSGTITPTQSAGTMVALGYSLDGGTTWNTFATTRIDGSGSYSITWYPPYPATYEVRASWSGNANYADATSSAGSLSVTGARPPQVMLLVAGPPSVARGGTATFDVLVTNPPGSSLATTIYIELIGPGGYEYFDTLQVSVAAGTTGRYQFTWQAPSAGGSYQVVVGLIPPRPASISQTQITIT